MGQSLAKVHIHAVFSTKNREPTLDAQWRDELFHVIGGTVNHPGCQSLLVGGVEDHVHALFMLARTVTLADTIGRMKSNSSAWINQRHASEVPFAWQGGYAVFSMSRSGARLHRSTAGAPRAPVVPGRAAGMAAALRHSMGRYVWD